MSLTEIKFPHYSSPVDYDKFLDGILLTIYRVGKAATSKEIEQKESSLGDHIAIGRACSFLSWMRLVNGNHSPFELTETGRDIAIAMAQNKASDALAIWKKILFAHPLYLELQSYMKTQGGNAGTSLGFGEHLRKLSGKNLNSTFVKEAGKRICVLFGAKGLIEFNRKDDIISFPTGTDGGIKDGTNDQQSDEIAAGREISKIGTATILHKDGEGIATTFNSVLPCNITVTVEAKDPESIKQVIELIRELTGKRATGPSS